MRLVRIAVWLAVLGYALVLGLGARAGFPEDAQTGSRMPYLADKPIGEDGFYMLTVAWHLGTGRGLTYNSDGAVTGIQPLSTLVDGGVAAVVSAAGGDRWTFARAMIVVGFLQWGLVAIVLTRLTLAMTRTIDPPTRELASALAGLLVLLSYNTFRMSLYGLETPLYLLLLGLCVTMSLNGTRSTAAAIRLGIVAGLTAWARIDFLVVLAIFLGVEFVRARMPLSRAIIVGATAGAVVSPWFATVYALSGHLMPTSGRLQSSWPANTAEIALRVMHMGDALAQHLSPWLYLPAMRTAMSAVTGLSLANALATLAVACVGGVVVWRGWRSLAKDVAAPMASWALALAVLFVIYVAMFWPVFFYVRYTAPLVALTFPLMALGLTAAVPNRRMLTAVPIAMLAGFAATAWLTLHTGRIGNSHSLSAGHIARKLPPPAVVGAYQSGAVGYFNPNVVNLDGKVNSGLLAALDTGTFPAYVKARGLTHVVDWPEVGQPGSYFGSWPDCGLGRFGFSICLANPAP